MQVVGFRQGAGNRCRWGRWATDGARAQVSQAMAGLEELLVAGRRALGEAAVGPTHAVADVRSSSRRSCRTPG